MYTNTKKKYFFSTPFFHACFAISVTIMMNTGAFTVYVDVNSGRKSSRFGQQVAASSSVIFRAARCKRPRACVGTAAIAPAGPSLSQRRRLREVRDGGEMGGVMAVSGKWTA